MAISLSEIAASHTLAGKNSANALPNTHRERLQTGESNQPQPRVKRESMRKRKVVCRVFSILSVGLVLAGCRTLSEGATEGETPQRSPELEVLNHFVGTWDMKVTATSAEGEATTSDARSVRTWSHGGTFVVFDDPDAEGMLLALTYDPDSKTYPGVMIIGTDRSLMIGSWNEDTKTMHWSIRNVDQETTFLGSHRFIRDDYAEASGSITNADGQVVVKLSWKQIRRRETAEQGDPP